MPSTGMPDILVVDSLAHGALPESALELPSRFADGSGPGDDGHLGRLFLAMAGERFSAPALTTPSAEWSYGRLLAAARMVAEALIADRSFVPGARVVLLLPNSAEYVAAFYGTLL